MSLKKTLVWLVVAGSLFAFIFFYQRHRRPAAAGPAKVLPELRPEAVTSILIRPSGPVQLQIRADRTNGEWILSQPLVYPAQAAKIQKLLEFLEQLHPAPYLTVSEVRNHPEEDYGFASPQATLVIQQGPYLPRVRVGASTIPGDQVFLQVEGDLGAYVVDAELLKYLPRSADDWRDTSLTRLNSLVFDRIGVTNNSKGDPGRPGLPAASSTFVLQRDLTNRVWRMVWPLDARADNSRIEEALKKLQNLRVRQFVSDDPKADLESMGLAPADLELGIGNGTNTLELLQFGRSPTNDVTKIYARRAGQPGVVSVNKDLLLGWCSVLNDFRDPHLLALPDRIDCVEFVNGNDHSFMERQTNGNWRLMPEDCVADQNLVANLFSTLTNVSIKFINDVVSPADLSGYGLAPPLYRLLIKTNCAGSASAPTNAAVTELDFGFGTNLHDKVFARRTDETFVYAITTNDFLLFPSGSWQLRDRVLCRFPVSDVSGLTFKSGAKICQMVHKGPLSWTFAPGSQGIINDAAVEETVRGVIQTSAVAWAGRGAQSRASFGFAVDGPRLSLQLKTGGTFDLEFGGEAPSGNVYASVVLDGQPWIMEFPWALFRDINSYLPLSAPR